MAKLMENLTKSFSNTRSRVIIIITLSLLLIAVLVGVYKLMSVGSGEGASASLRGAASISSIPGSLNPTEQYAQLQEQQNIDQAKRAARTGTSSVPTLIRSQRLGQGEEVGSPEGEGGLGFTRLALKEEGYGSLKAMWLQSLRDSHCAAKDVQTALSEGATFSDIKEACSCTQLKAIGYSVTDLRRACECTELKEAGFTATQLRNAGFDAIQLYECGFDACEMKAAGFSAEQLKAAGYSDGELKGAGFSAKEIREASGLPPGITAEDLRRGGCGVEALRKAREAGVSAAAIRRIVGCDAAALKAAGYTAAELKAAGFTAAELKKAGFSAAELKAAGFDADDLYTAGFSYGELAAAGFSEDEIRRAAEALPVGISVADVRKAGCDVAKLAKRRKAGVSAAAIRKYNDCSLDALKAAGFSDQDLLAAGFNADEIGKSKAELYQEPPDEQSVEIGLPPDVSEDEVRAAGCDIEQLKRLRRRGVSAEAIVKYNDCDAATLRAAGYSAKELAKAGLSLADLKAAGFSDDELRALDDAVMAALTELEQKGCEIEALRAARAAGVSASEIRRRFGCDAATLKAAGYTAEELKAAGFTAAELRKAGFSAAELKAAGFSADQLRDAGFSATELKAAGFSAAELRAAGFSADELSAAGFSLDDLIRAGFSPSELRAAGFTAEQLLAAGVSAEELRKAGYDQKGQGFDSRASVASLQTPEDRLEKPSGTQSTEDRLDEILQQQAAQMSEQRLQQQILQRRAAMNSEANRLVGAVWAAPIHSYVGSYDETAMGIIEEDEKKTGTQAETTFVGDSTAIKAGDITFAVMETSVNSDEPGPILARIVEGKFKGAKLIGSFSLPPEGQKLLLTFNTMSVPGEMSTNSINAIAIDPDTARTSLASHVDNHYLLRYGSLIGSAFLEGIGGAVQTEGTTVTISGDNTTTVSNGLGRSATENVIIGMTEVGKKLGSVAGQLFNTKPTVKIHAGTGMGILFMRDTVAPLPSKEVS